MTTHTEEHVYTIRLINDRFLGAEIGLDEADKTAQLMARVHGRTCLVVHNARIVSRWTPEGNQVHA